MAKKRPAAKPRQAKPPAHQEQTEYQRRAARQKGEQEQHVWTYDDLVKLTGKARNTIYQHVARGSFDPEDLFSVVVWLARHAKPQLKRRMIDYALDIDEGTEKGE